MLLALLIKHTKAPYKRRQHCWSCVLLGVTAQTLKLVKLLSQQLPTFLLFRDRRYIAQQCWIRLHSSSNTVAATQAYYTWSPKSYGLYPSHDALQVQTFLAQRRWELLRPFARSLRESGCVKISIPELKHSSKFQQSKNLQNVNYRVEVL